MTRTELTAALKSAGLRYEIDACSPKKSATGDCVFVDGRDIRTPAQEKVITGLVDTLGWVKTDAGERGVHFFI